MSAEELQEKSHELEAERFAFEKEKAEKDREFEARKLALTQENGRKETGAREAQG
jgi:hypothetical protein